MWIWPYPWTWLGIVGVGLFLPGCAEPAPLGVVAIAGHPGVCAATIIDVEDDGLAHTLTAAHCCMDTSPEQMLVFAGDDYANSTATFVATDIQKHPLYDGDTHDFCIVTFQGHVDIIPPDSAIVPLRPDEDTLAIGASLETMGYGSGTKRRTMAVVLASVEEFTVSYPLNGNGPCPGDSGGPSFVLLNDQMRLGAVVSRGPADCSGGVGVSGRVSSIFDDFIAPYLAGKPYPIKCGDCLEAAVSPVGPCAPVVNACVADSGCLSLVECLADDSGPCIAETDALELYGAVKDCSCANDCSSACAEDAFCL